MDITTRNIEQCDAVSVLNAIMDMHDHPQKIDQIAAAISPIATAAAAYSEGKPQLAQAITAKGVPTAADASLATMAQNVSAIIQQQTIISGGDAYKQQLFSDADPTKAVLWDLYQVLAQMKTLYLSGESSYTGLLVCEYDKSLDAVDLDKASAWVCSDMVDKTTPILSTDDMHHVWNDANDGKANRWICFLYTNSAGGTFTITSSDAALSPLSIYVGGHIQTIEYQTNGKLTELVSGLTENDYVDNFISAGYSQKWGSNLILRNVKNIGSQIIASTSNVVCIDIEEITAGSSEPNGINVINASYINLPKLTKVNGGGCTVWGGNNKVLSCENLEEINLSYKYLFRHQNGTGKSTQVIYLPKLKRMARNAGISYYNSCPNLIDLWVGEMETNFKDEYFNPTNVLSDATKTATLISNIRNHILARISTRPQGSELTFTISQNMYNAITTADTDLEADFLAKGWHLAGI